MPAPETARGIRDLCEERRLRLSPEREIRRNLQTDVAVTGRTPFTFNQLGRLQATTKLAATAFH